MGGRVEVDDADVEGLGIDDDVGRFDVLVHDPLAVHVMKAIGDLKGDVEEDERRKRTTLKEEILEGEGIAASREDKDKDAIVHVETIHLGLSHLWTGRSVKTQIGMTVKIEKDFEYVKNSCHLSKDQHSMSFVFETFQEKIELLKLSTIVLNQLFGWK